MTSINYVDIISNKIGKNVSGNGNDLFLVTDVKRAQAISNFPPGPPITAGFKIKGARDEWVIYENLAPPNILMGVIPSVL